ncbi:MAG: biotin--[acetyl-CoA-carboxylase] ligase [Treponema sp.]|nr:biotin--[acetyl-CoA-carboxylase] ligase [Treponema sp.]
MENRVVYEYMMNTLGINNPFGAPVYYKETVSSTMDEARLLAARLSPHGTVISAGFQESGRGRTRGRPWNADRGKNLFFTIIFRYPEISRIPRAITLRTGLALSLAVEDFEPLLLGHTRVKWPNDLMIFDRKAAGILTEAEGGTVYTGIGVNVAQSVFPAPLKAKATSLFLAREEARHSSPPGPEPEAGACLSLLERILPRLYGEFNALPSEADAWRKPLTERLYRRGGRVRFLSGGAETGKPVEGVLAGIGTEGELLILPEGERECRSFVTGELMF